MQGGGNTWGEEGEGGGEGGAGVQEAVLGQQLAGVGVQQRGQGRGGGGHQVRPLVPLPPPEEGAIVEHVLGHGVQRPEVALARVARLPRHLDETVVETEVVADGVLPLRELLLVVGEPRPDEVADATQGEPLVGRLEDGHGDEGDVGVGRLHHPALLVPDLVLSSGGRLLVLLVAVQLGLVTPVPGVPRLVPEAVRGLLLDGLGQVAAEVHPRDYSVDKGVNEISR